MRKKVVVLLALISCLSSLLMACSNSGKGDRGGISSLQNSTVSSINIENAQLLGTWTYYDGYLADGTPQGYINRVTFNEDGTAVYESGKYGEAETFSAKGTYAINGNKIEFILDDVVIDEWPASGVTVYSFSAAFHFEDGELICKDFNGIGGYGFIAGPDLNFRADVQR